MTSLAVALGRRIRRNREAKGLSQEGFAERCGLHRTYVTQLESGQRNPSLSTIERVAKALGLDAGELIQQAERERPTKAASR